MNEKIKQLLIDKNLTPSRFADEIGVQRASISHILSGRNRPSLEIIQKILKKYPEIDFDWFSNESNNASEIIRQRVNNQANNNPKPYNPISSESNGRKLTERLQGQSNVAQLQNPQKEKQIEKILVFYSDNTFSEYKPFN